MALNVGDRLGHYAVTALIGEGGMGQVYRATDTQLGRDVALKILPDAFAADPDRLARFQREAQVLASLNHPGIAAIYGIEEAEGTRALVLELVEGPTLADRIAKGPIPIDEALPIAKQIAEALEAAHEAGVIHRDLKPANIKVREDGTVKVLDFGLAKALDPTPTGDPSQSPTLTAAATKMGVIMGTAAYMSPEQASGQTADARSDIWSFGVVLFEMLTGQRLFTGKTVSHVLAKVLDREIDFAGLPTTTPAPLKRLLRRCLEREPKRRLRDVGEAVIHIEEAAGAPADEPVATSSTSIRSPGWRQALPHVLGSLFVGGVFTGLAVWSLMLRVPSEPRDLTRFVVITPPDGPLRQAGGSPEVAISPDGTRIVYGAGSSMASWQLYRRQVGELVATPLRGTEGGSAPFFSPDGEWVGFWTFTDSALKKVSVLGGPAVMICDLGGFPQGMSWGLDDTIVFASTASQGLMRVPAVGGEPEVLTTVDPDQEETAHRWPEVLPNGKAVLFTAWSGSDETSRIAVVSLETGAITYLVPGGSNPHYSPTGHIVYGVAGTLRAVGFDPDRLELTNNTPVPVVENVNTKTSGAANFSVSANGSLVYVSGGVAAGGGPPRTLVWVDREGREEPLGLPPNTYEWPRVSPDGRRVAVDIQGADPDVWVSDLARPGTLSKVTTDPATDRAPLWAPDGARVVFASDREGQRGLFWKAADGRGDVERLVTVDKEFVSPYGWSADGGTLVFTYQDPGTGLNIGLLSLEGDRSWQPLLQTDASESAAAISPGGDWIAYHSDETGPFEIYVERFPALGDRQVISTGGGQDPVWSPDGRELFYRSPNEELMGVAVETEPGFTAGTPEVVFEGRYFDTGGRRYDIAPDGQRFLMIKEGASTDDASVPAAEIIVVQHWFDELQRLVPTP